jgi:hypothetical protein
MSYSPHFRRGWNKNRTLILTMALAFVITVEGHASPADPDRKSLLDPADGGIAVFPPNQEQKWIWKLDPASPARSSATTIQWTLRYWDGTEAGGEAAFRKPTPPAQGATTPASTVGDAPPVISFSFIPAKLGWAQLTARLVDAAGGTLATEDTTLTIGTPDRSKNRAFRYGFCSHSDWLKEDEYKLSIQTLGASGIDILRDVPEWGSLEPVEGKWAFEKMDRLVNDTGKYGIEIQPFLGFTTQWASTGDPNAKNWHDWAAKMPRLDPWLTYVKTMVNRYGDRIHNWEVWNEPDHIFWLDTPENYLLLFNQTAAAIKQVSPSAKVMNGGLTFLENGQDGAVRYDLVTKGDKANWDTFAYHSYMTLQQLLEKSKEVDHALKDTGLEKMPRWLNESGAHTLVPDGERVQVLQLIKKISLSPALGIEAYCWYDLRDDGIDASTTEHRLGVVDYFYRPVPAYAAYQNLIRELASRHYFPPANASVPHAPSTDGVWLTGYAAKDGGEHRLVAWREGGVSSPTVLHWPEGTTIKGVDDAMGNPVEFSHVGKYAIVPLGDEPIYIAFTGKAVYPEVNSLLRVPSVLAALPGQAGSLAIGIHNPMSDPLQISLKGTLTESGKVLFDQTLQLAPGEDKNLTTDISWPQGLLASGKVALEVNFPSAGNHFDSSLPYQAARVIPHVAAQTDKEGQPQIVLNQRENIVSLSEGLAQADRDWKGPDDLSATASFSYDETALHIAIDVQDDVHFQEGNPLKLWQGDSLQLAIKLDDADISYLQATIALAGGQDPVTWVDKVPSGGHIALGTLPPEVIRSVERQGTHTVYRVDLPWADLGSNGVPKGPFRVSFLVNDNDGTGRRQWLELSPGIGQQQDPSLFPLFLCK